MRCTLHLGARLVGHVVGSCIMVAPAYVSDTSGLDFQQFVEEFAGKKEFFVALASATLSVAGTAVAVAQLDQAKRSADEAKRSADEAFKTSPEGKIQQALAKAMEPFEPSRPQDEVIQRPVMETLRQRIASWQQHATIIGGRYQSGKSVATEEALRGARGVVRFTIEKCRLEEDRMCKHLGVDDEVACSKRSCAERARSSRTFPTTSPSFQSFFLKSLVQPPKDWLDKICFSVVYRCCSAFCPSLFVSVPLAEAST